MARDVQRDVDIRLKSTDETKAAIDQARTRLTGLRGLTSGITSQMSNDWVRFGAVLGGGFLGFQALKSGILSINEAGMESEKVWNNVASSLRNQGRDVDVLLPKLDAWATGFMNLTGISDELAGEAFVRLHDMGLSVEQSMQLVASAADLAKAKDMDLLSASDQIAKSLVGQRNALRAYGVELDKTKTISEQATQAQAGLAEKFGGRAAAQLDTLQGKVGLLGEKWDNVKEKLFAIAFAPVIENIASIWIPIGEAAGTSFVDAFTGKVQTTLPLRLQEVAPGIFQQVWQGPQVSEESKKAGAKFMDDFFAGTGEFAPKTDSVSTFADTMIEAQRLAFPQIALEGTTLQDILTADLERALDHRKQLQIKFANDQAARGAEMSEREIERRQADFEREKQLQELKLDIVQNSLGSMAQAMQTFSQISGKHQGAAFVAFKAFAVAEAVIDAHRAFGRALATLPPPFSYIAAAAVFATAMARVSAIVSTQAPGGGGSVSAPSTAAPTVVQPAQAAQTVTRSGPEIVNVYFMGGTYGSEDQIARRLVPAIRRAYADGVR